MSSTWQPLPLAWVERIFDRFSATYGVQKLSSMWSGSDVDTVKAVWAQALGKYPRDALSAAVLSVADEHPSWPPTLGEFKALCEQHAAPELRRALPVPPRSKEEIERGAVEMQKIRAMLGKAIKRMPTRVPGEDDE